MGPVISVGGLSFTSQNRQHSNSRILMRLQRSLRISDDVDNESADADSHEG